MAATGNGRSMLSDINVTPLVDIMLVLLVIMMVTASTVVSKALAVNLPEAKTGQSESTQLVVVVQPDGAWSVDDLGVDEAALATLVAQSDRGPVLIAADGETRHKSVARLMDALNNLGVQRIAVGIRPKAQ